MSRVRDFIKKYLIPYNRHVEVIDIKEASSSSGEGILEDTFSWIGGGAYCQRVAWVPIDPSCVIEVYWIGEEETAICEEEEITWEGINPYCQQ